MICVDTGAWFASVVPTDRDHEAAVHWLHQNTQPFITTDYVLDETLTLLKARGQALRALQLGEQFFHGALATVYYLTQAFAFDHHFYQFGSIEGVPQAESG